MIALIGAGALSFVGLLWWLVKDDRDDTHLRIPFVRCEACLEPGAYRPDYDAVLCDTHAEVPSYLNPRGQR